MRVIRDDDTKNLILLEFAATLASKHRLKRMRPDVLSGFWRKAVHDYFDHDEEVLVNVVEHLLQLGEDLLRRRVYVQTDAVHERD